MNGKLITTFWVVGYAFLAGLLLTFFTHIEQLHRYLFSVLALYIGIRFFRRFETLGLRITFFVLGIIFFLLISVVFALITYIKEHPLPAAGV